MEKTLVIIPAYNEERNLSEIITQVLRYNQEVDILVVNDGSTDSTSNIASNHGAIVLDLPFNMGYGVALQTGFKYALNAGYNYVVQIDADGQHDPKCINELLNELMNNKVDLIIGSRFLSKTNYKVPFIRLIGIRFFNLVAFLMTGQRITDCTSGYRASNRQVLDFYSSDIYPWDYPDADVLIMLYFAGFRFKEIPVTMFESKSGKSMHNGLKPLYYIFEKILSIFVILLRKKPHKKGGTPRA
jgi:glycosyltransferase involved in cell wall biosynthesis